MPKIQIVHIVFYWIYIWKKKILCVACCINPWYSTRKHICKPATLWKFWGVCRVWCEWAYFQEWRKSNGSSENKEGQSCSFPPHVVFWQYMQSWLYWFIRSVDTRLWLWLGMVQQILRYVNSMKLPNCEANQMLLFWVHIQHINYKKIVPCSTCLY